MTVRVEEIEAAAALVGVAVAPEHLPGVARFLGIARELAAVVEQAPLDADELALASVFRLPDGEG